MMQVIATLSLQNQATHVREEPMNGGEGAGNAVVKSNWGKTTRFEFPKFDGDGFEGWVMRSEYFFEVAEVPSAEKVRIVALYLEGRALQWHKGFVSLHGEGAYKGRDYYIKALATRFGAHAYEDPLSDMRNLKHVRSLQSYMDNFDELYPRTRIREDQALSFFLSGLIDELQMPVRMFKPSSLAVAYALAKLQQLIVKAMYGKTKISSSGNQNTSSYNSNNKSLTVTATSLKSAIGGVNNRM